MHSSVTNLRYIESAPKTKKQKRKNRRATTVNDYQQTALDLTHLDTIQPKTEKQQLFFDLYKTGNKFINLHGIAGTGKTFISVYKALEEVLEPSSRYKKVLIVRTAVQSRDQGFLPGNIKEKMEAYTEPYKQICTTLFHRKDAWTKLVNQGVIEFVSTSFLRGMTYDNCIIIFDEVQNGNFEEINTVVTRLGNHSKIMFCGDYRQTDLTKNGDRSGIMKFIRAIDKMKSADTVEFGINDIVRNPIIKEWIIATLED